MSTFPEILFTSQKHCPDVTSSCYLATATESLSHRVSCARDFLRCLTLGAVAVTFAAPLTISARPAAFCHEVPTRSASMSYGFPSNGRVEGAEKISDSDYARVLPDRHRARCLSWGTQRLVRAIVKAGAVVASKHPGTPPLGVGNIGRARGGSIRMYSRSHHAGRDADLSFYLIDSTGKPVASTDLLRINSKLDGFDVPRNWTLVEALLGDASIEVRWLFVTPSIKRALLEEGRRQGASTRLLARAAEVLHQPSDSSPHDDHLHLRIRCTTQEKRIGCRDG